MEALDSIGIKLFIGDRQNSGSIRQYRNKTVYVGCTGRILVMSRFLYSFVCLCCVL